MTGAVDAILCVYGGSAGTGEGTPCAELGPNVISLHKSFVVAWADSLVAAVFEPEAWSRRDQLIDVDQDQRICHRVR